MKKYLYVDMSAGLLFLSHLTPTQIALRRWPKVGSAMTLGQRRLLLAQRKNVRQSNVGPTFFPTLDQRWANVNPTLENGLIRWQNVGMTLIRRLHND